MILSLLDGGIGDGPGEALMCSRTRCTVPAKWAIQWRNPKIHTADRRKNWLACDEHLPVLRDFLEARSFPLQVVAVDEL